MIMMFMNSFCRALLINAILVSGKPEKLFPKDLEIPAKDTRIVGGVVAPIGAYPWFTALLTRNPLDWRGCGGMLVHPDVVLTAAHCVPGAIASEMAVGIGLVCLDATNCGEPAEVINVESVISHPDYDSGTLNHDFALLKLVSPATTTPVPMDDDRIVDNYPSTKRNLYAIGFGTTSSGGSISTQLRHVELAFVTRDTCNASYGAGSITDNMMCAADPGQDSCQGDSGGPLYDQENGAVVGVVSWGYGCADPSYPGVYAQISSQLDWITSNICENTSSLSNGICSNYSPRPSTSPVPSSVPSAGCADGELDLRIFLKTDNYSTETSWTVETAGGVLVQSAGPFAQDYTDYNSRACLDAAECYIFTILDSYGDGLNSNGDLTVSVDGLVVMTRPTNSFTSESVQFGENCVAPTPTPSDSPTVLPTCDSNELGVNILLKTDNYSTETSWTVETAGGALVQSAGPFPDDYTDYNSLLCLDPTECYIFTILDSYGDGLNSNGDLTVSVDGLVVMTRPTNSFTSESVQFGQCDTGSSSLAPSSPPSSVNCGVGTKLFSLYLLTDNYGSETSFEVYSRNVFSKIGDVVFSGSNFNSATEYNLEKCLDMDLCYQLFVYDSAGDGICCSYGTGTFEGTWDGDILLNKPAVFDSGYTSKSKTFGTCSSMSG